MTAVDNLSPVTSLHDIPTKGYLDGRYGAGIIFVRSTSLVPEGTEAGTVVVVTDAAPARPYIADHKLGYDAGSADPSTITLGKPASLADGDVLLAVIGMQASGLATDMTPPAGFARVNFPFVSPTGSDHRYLGFWAKMVADAAGEPAAYSWTYTGAPSSRSNMVMLAVRGAGSVTGYAPRTTVKDLASQPVPSAPVASDGSLAVLAVTRNLGAGSDPSLSTVPAGWSLLTDNVGGVNYASASTTQLAVMVRTQVPSGSVGGGTIAYKTASTNGTIASVVLGPSA